jgi:hypothetical protein
MIRPITVAGARRIEWPQIEVGADEPGGDAAQPRRADRSRTGRFDLMLLLHNFDNHGSIVERHADAKECRD